MFPVGLVVFRYRLRLRSLSTKHGHDLKNTSNSRTSIVRSESTHPGGTEVPPSGGDGTAAVTAAEVAGTDSNGPEGIIVEVEGGVKIEEVLEEQRLLRLELEEANQRMEKARRGRKVAEKVRYVHHAVHR